MAVHPQSKVTQSRTSCLQQNERSKWTFILDRISNLSAFTFYYAAMLVVATLIAAGGLATNNAVIVVASMLVSPLMGPVLAFTFGVTLHEGNMAKLGLQNELLSLVICVLGGFVVGFFYSLLSSNAYDWPTEQMSSRGSAIGLADGAFIAAASGVGVALSVLGDYLSTVVGVAISASLLPPAVNCGMLFAFRIYVDMYDDGHSVDDKQELLQMAGFSLLLTIENIIIIFAVSRFMFYVKNVYISKDQHENMWKSFTNFNAAKQQQQEQQQKNSVQMQMQVASSPPQQQQQPQQGGTLTDRMRQSMRIVLDNYERDFDGTIKGGIMSMNAHYRASTPRQPRNAAAAAGHNRGNKAMREISEEQPSTSSVIMDGNEDATHVLKHASTAAETASNKVKKDVAEDSDASDHEADDEPQKQQGKRANVNDIFS